MEEITKDTTNTEQPMQQPDQAGKTFTQEEVNRIVSDRLARDRERRTAELDEREKAVKARELAVIAVEKLTAAGLPKEMAGVLKYDDEKTLEEAIEKISKMQGFDGGKNTNKSGLRVFQESRLPEVDPWLQRYGADPVKAAFRPVKD